MLSTIRGRADGVGYEVVDCRHSRGVEVVQPRDLYGSGPQCEHQQPISGRVPGEINKDIDLIDSDLRGRCVIA